METCPQCGYEPEELPPLPRPAEMVGKWTDQRGTNREHLIHSAWYYGSCTEAASECGVDLSITIIRPPIDNPPDSACKICLRAWEKRQ